jgi:hypothetical protein
MYHAKTTFLGFKIGLKNDSKYIGVPDSKWLSEKVSVEFNGKIKEYGKDQVETKLTFPDKFGRAKEYTLLYVKWS